MNEHLPEKADMLIDANADIEVNDLVKQGFQMLDAYAVGTWRILNALLNRGYSVQELIERIKQESEENSSIAMPDYNAKKWKRKYRKVQSKLMPGEVAYVYKADEIISHYKTGIMITNKRILYFTPFGRRELPYWRLQYIQAPGMVRAYWLNGTRMGISEMGCTKQSFSCILALICMFAREVNGEEYRLEIKGAK